jgi:hypothetical protein
MTSCPSRLCRPKITASEMLSDIFLGLPPIETKEKDITFRVTGEAVSTLHAFRGFAVEIPKVLITSMVSTGDGPSRLPFQLHLKGPPPMLTGARLETRQQECKNFCIVCMAYLQKRGPACIGSQWPRGPATACGSGTASYAYRRNLRSSFLLQGPQNISAVSLKTALRPAQSAITGVTMTRLLGIEVSMSSTTALVIRATWAKAMSPAKPSPKYTSTLLPDWRLRHHLSAS